MIIFPDISPIALQLGPISIHWYGLGYVVGLLLAWTFSRRLVSNSSLWRPHSSPITLTDIDDIIMWMVFGIILGGRLGYVLFYNFSFYLSQPLQIFAIWDGGMSFHGGTLGVALSTLIFVRNRGISPYSMLDIITVSSCFGLFLVRLTNFINSELWGKPTDLPWGVLFPNGGLYPRHPSQLYEAALEGIVLFLILCFFIYRRGKLTTPGFIGGAWLSLYALARISIEFVREPDSHIGYLLGDTLTTGMLLCLPMLLIGIWAIWSSRHRIPY